MLDKQFWRSEALLIFEVVGNYGLAGAQSIATGRRQIDSHTCRTDYAITPANSRTNQKTILGWYVFHDFAVFRLQSFRRQTGGVIEHLREVRALQSKDTQLGKYSLLANA